MKESSNIKKKKKNSQNKIFQAYMSKNIQIKKKKLLQKKRFSNNL